MDDQENPSGLLTSVRATFAEFLSQDLVTIALTTVFVVTIAILWARGPLENITHHLRES